MTALALEIARLYEKEHGRQRAFVRRIFGNPAAAEDVVQQVFANILGKQEQASSPSAAYVMQAVRNLALNHLRDTRRRGNVEQAGLDLDLIADISPSPETIAVYRSELRRLLEATAAGSVRAQPHRRAFL